MEAHLHVNEETGTDLKNVSESVPVHYSVNLYVAVCKRTCMDVRQCTSVCESIVTKKTKYTVCQSAECGIVFA